MGVPEVAFSLLLPSAERRRLLDAKGPSLLRAFSVPLSFAFDVGVVDGFRL